MKTDEKIYFFSLLAIALLVISFFSGVCNENARFKKEAVKANVAYWTADEKGKA